MTPHAAQPVKERGGTPRRALVTGGAIRLGRAIALALAGDGLDVAIGYHRSAREARRTVADLEARGVRAAAIRADLRDARGAGRLVERAADALGGLDVLVNNAALFYRTPFGATTVAQYDELLAVNLRAPFFCAQAAAALLGPGGHIVNIADVGSGRAWPGYIPYTVSKAGVVALTRSLAAALRARRIAVNCVSPGAVLRPSRFPRARWAALTADAGDHVADVTAAVRFFVSCPAYITGQVLEVAVRAERRPRAGHRAPRGER